MSSWADSWGTSWGSSWGETNPNALRGSAHGSSTASAAITVVAQASAETSYGGWASLQRKERKSKEQLEQERIALGILPPKVAKSLQVVAKQAIAKATEERQPDILDWINKQEIEAIYAEALRDELRQAEQQWQDAYQQAIYIAIEQELQAEEEMIMFLMMEL